MREVTEMMWQDKNNQDPKSTEIILFFTEKIKNFLCPFQKKLLECQSAVKATSNGKLSLDTNPQQINFYSKFMNTVKPPENVSC
jgi:hypothetical protein